MTRTEAAHTNGALSHGPVTEEGKARSSQNAQKHGFSSSQVVITGENAAEFDALLDSYTANYQPASALEQDLVFEMTSSRWRLRRAALMEKAVIEVELRRVANDKENPVADPELARMMAWAAVADSPAMKQIHRHETRLRRAYEKAVKEITRLQQERHAQEELAARNLVRRQMQQQPPPAPRPELRVAIPAVQNEPVQPATPPLKRAA